LVSTVERRLRKIEEIVGEDDECPRCSGTVIVSTGGIEDASAPTISATKNGQRFSPEAAEKFAAEEEPGGICPRCSKKRLEVRVGWSGLDNSR
jgi:DNA-directed RNA polymerase subunit RPC12/RpoP